MIYLRAVINRVTDDFNIANKSKLLKSDESILEFLLKNEIKIEDIKREFKSYYGIDFINIKDLDIDKSLIQKFDINSLRDEKVIPYMEDKENKVFHFAIGDMTNEKSRKLIRKASKDIGYKVNYSFALSSHINYKYENINIKKNEVKKINTEENKDEFNAKDWVDSVIDKGISLRASDIHIEQFEEIIKIRYRVDGELSTENKHSLTDGQISNISVRIKMISAMDISEKRKPQDGRIDEYEYNNSKYDLRVSSITTITGEKFTMRLFEKSSKTATFKDLGFTPQNEKSAKSILDNKNGIVYLGGPTGSGKTTTLYSMIDVKNNDNINIYTIENPVEKTIPNINQIQINELAGVTYASTLRALLRQDPDIIVVGETRDRETTELSVRASLTGHLVLTTIHANNALDSISRVADMGIEPYLIGASAVGFMSQRLVKKLCVHCKEREKLNGYQLEWLKRNKERYNLDIDLEKITVYKAKGCSKCNEGYRGRIAIVEVLEVDEKFRSLISSQADRETLSSEAIKNGFKPLVVDGIFKVIGGSTTIEEIMKEIN